MSSAAFVRRLPILLRPNPARTVIRPYMPSKDGYKYAREDRPRSQRIADRVLGLDEQTLKDELDRVLRDFSGRHRNVSSLFLRRFHEVEGIDICECQVSDEQVIVRRHLDALDAPKVAEPARDPLAAVVAWVQARLPRLPLLARFGLVS